jgi:DNA-nicking Smr family endonuclease
VLVVHGRGEHSPRGHGILRGEMAAWLSQGSASVHVAAFATAEPQDGGEGAIYVLLVR